MVVEKIVIEISSTQSLISELKMTFDTSKLISELRITFGCSRFDFRAKDVFWIIEVRFQSSGWLLDTQSLFSELWMTFGYSKLDFWTPDDFWIVKVWFSDFKRLLRCSVWFQDSGWLLDTYSKLEGIKSHASDKKGCVSIKKLKKSEPTGPSSTSSLKKSRQLCIVLFIFLIIIHLILCPLSYNKKRGKRKKKTFKSDKLIYYLNCMLKICNF